MDEERRCIENKNPFREVADPDPDDLPPDLFEALANTYEEVVTAVPEKDFPLGGGYYRCPEPVARVPRFSVVCDVCGHLYFTTRYARGCPFCGDYLASDTKNGIVTRRGAWGMKPGITKD